MTYFRAIRLLCLPVFFTGILIASPVYADGGRYRAAPPQTNYYGDSHYRAPGHYRTPDYRAAPDRYRSAPSVQVQSSGYRLHFGSGDSRPGLSPSYRGHHQDRNRHHRPERHHRGYDRSSQYPKHMPHAHPGNPRAGENRLGSGNTQMRRPPQMHDSGPMQRRQYERRYR